MTDSWAQSRARTLQMKAIATAEQIVDKTVEVVLVFCERADIEGKAQMEERIRFDQLRQMEMSKEGMSNEFI